MKGCSFSMMLLILVSVLSCADPIENQIPEIMDNLGEYVNINKSFPLTTDSLIACAVGGTDALATEIDFPISVLYFPKGTASEFHYFETENASDNPELLHNYWLQDYEQAPVFNGYLRKFKREGLNSNVWGIVSFIRDKKIFISNPIRIKYDTLPTENNEESITIDQSDELEPKFTWEDGDIKENKIYFHVVSDLSGNLISGTYTFEKQFQYYRLDNVVLNIKPQDPITVLRKGEEYNFTLMGVSEDNWVNLAMEKSFIAE